MSDLAVLLLATFCVTFPFMVKGLLDFSARRIDRRIEKRMAAEYDRVRGYDRPLAERAAELRELSKGAPVIVHRIARPVPADHGTDRADEETT